jgi:hypothetical protein
VDDERRRNQSKIVSTASHVTSDKTVITYVRRQCKTCCIRIDQTKERLNETEKEKSKSITNKIIEEDEEDLYFGSSDSENEDMSSDHSSNTDTTNRIENEAMKRMKVGRVETTTKGRREGTIKTIKMKVTNGNLPVGHICDDIVVDVELSLSEMISILKC